MVFLCTTCLADDAETLYKKAVRIEYKSGMQAALTHYKELIEKHPNSDRATQAIEKIISYRKQLEKKSGKIDTGENATGNRGSAGGDRRQVDKVKRIASFRLSRQRAFRLITDECGLIRSKADFVFSSRCEFTILDVTMTGAGFKKVAKITAHGRGYFYDLTFTVVYGLTYDIDGNFTAKFIEVKKGKITGLSDLVRQFLGRND
jgi:hypothetical protein